MNIFVIDNDPVIAAQNLCNKHAAGKMVVESAQMLSTSHRILDGTEIVGKTDSGRKQKQWILSDNRDSVVYKAAHINHPCSVWVRQSIANYNWLYKHFIALCDEYTHRYGKLHKTDALLRDILKVAPNNIPQTQLTAFALAMPDSCKTTDPVESYRQYYLTKKEKFAMIWSKREIPNWFIV